jgi:hypothetical protein
MIVVLPGRREIVTLRNLLRAGFQFDTISTRRHVLNVAHSPRSNVVMLRSQADQMRAFTQRKS